MILKVIGTKVFVLVFLLLSSNTLVMSLELENSIESKGNNLPLIKNEPQPVSNSKIEPRELINKSKRLTKKTPVERKMKVELTSKQPDKIIVFNKASVSSLKNRIKSHARKMKQIKQQKIVKKTMLFRAFKLKMKEIDRLSEVKDGDLKNDLTEITNVVMDTGAIIHRQLHNQVSNKVQEKLLKLAKKKLETFMKTQISRYRIWQKDSWKKITEVLKRRGPLMLKNEELNRSEHEKLYQLFIVENAEKRAFLLPILNIEANIIKIISSKLNDLKNEQYLRISVKLMTQQLTKEFKHRYKRYKRLYKKEYLRDVYKTDDQYMASWKENDKFNESANF